MISQTQLDDWHNSSRRFKNNHAKLLALFDEVLRTIESVNSLEQYKASCGKKK